MSQGTKFYWSFFTERPDQLGVLKNIPIIPGFNTDTVIKQWREHPAKVKILKDHFFGLKGRHDEVIEKDSLNIFLVRDPEYVFTSFLPTSNQCFYDAASSALSDIGLFYDCMLDGIEVVSKICSKPPLIIDGESDIAQKDTLKELDFYRIRSLNCYWDCTEYI